MTKDNRIDQSKEKKLTGGNFWSPKEADEVLGKFVAIRQGSYGRDVYDIRHEDGIITVPSAKALEDVLTKDLLDKKIRIRFLGWKKSPSGRSYRSFDVFLIEG